MTFRPPTPLVSVVVLLVAVAVLAGCGTPPGVVANPSKEAAPARLIPPGPGGALAEITMAETTARMPVKLASSRSLQESVGTDGKTRLTAELSDFPVNNTTLSLTLLDSGGRYYIERCTLMVTGESGRENWKIDPEMVGNGEATLFVDRDGRWHLRFERVPIISDAWPQATTVSGVLVAYR